MAWRFYPLADFPDHGVLIDPDGRAGMARFVEIDPPEVRRFRMLDRDRANFINRGHGS